MGPMMGAGRPRGPAPRGGRARAARAGRAALAALAALAAGRGARARAGRGAGYGLWGWEAAAGAAGACGGGRGQLSLVGPGPVPELGPDAADLGLSVDAGGADWLRVSIRAPGAWEVPESVVPRRAQRPAAAPGSSGPCALSFWHSPSSPFEFGVARGSPGVHLGSAGGGGGGGGFGGGGLGRSTLELDRL